jgi:drug/metabolite transporter (DMT)-like permease
MYLYAFSMLFNGVFIIVYKPHLMSFDTWFTGYTPLTACIILTGALCGFSTALFLKYLNLILKEYAHSGEVFLTAILSALLFGVAIDAKMVVSMILVTVSVFIYNHKPATSTTISTSSLPVPATMQQQAVIKDDTMIDDDNDNDNDNADPKKPE